MKKVLQIRAGSNKLQLSTPNSSQLARKQSQINLPPINSLGVGESQKTLLVLLKNMQTYAQLHPGCISRMLNDCLSSIYKGLPLICNQQQNLSASSVLPIHKKMAQSAEMASPTENLISRSQVMNVKRTELKKVESRKLFEKVKAANCQGVIIKSDKQVISKLKRQITQMTQQLAKATSKIQQLEKTIQNNKKYAQQVVSTMISYQSNLKAQNMKNKKLQQRISKLNQEISLRKDSFSKQINRNKQKIYSLKVALEQRENQIKSLWILCHSQVKE